MKASLLEFEREFCRHCDRSFSPIRRNRDGSAYYYHVCPDGKRDSFRKYKNGEYMYLGGVTVGVRL